MIRQQKTFTYRNLTRKLGSLDKALAHIAQWCLDNAKSARYIYYKPPNSFEKCYEVAEKLAGDFLVTRQKITCILNNYWVRYDGSWNTELVVIYPEIKN